MAKNMHAVIDVGINVAMIAASEVGPDFCVTWAIVSINDIPNSIVINVVSPKSLA